jgi:hypothetical protein
MKKFVALFLALVLVTTCTVLAYNAGKKVGINNGIEDAIVSIHRIENGEIEIVIDAPNGQRYVHYDDGSDL